MGSEASVTGTRQRVFSANLGAELIVAQCGWSAEQEAQFGLDAIIAGEVQATRWTATRDGRMALTEWAAAGEDSGAAVYYERRFDDGAMAHGWVDADSRKVVQTG